jgi:hypothetical protein
MDSAHDAVFFGNEHGASRQCMRTGLQQFVLCSHCLRQALLTFHKHSPLLLSISPFATRSLVTTKFYQNFASAPRTLHPTYQ